MENNKVTIYLKENCIHCIQLKAWLKKHSINYIEKDMG